MQLFFFFNILEENSRREAAMKEKKTRTEITLILYSLSGMILGFVIFLLTSNFIFLIVFSTIGLTLGIASSDSKSDLISDENRE